MRASAIPEPVHEPPEETALDRQRRLWRRRCGTLRGDRLVVVGTHDRVDDLVLAVVLRALDLGNETDQNAVAHHLGLQRGRAIGVPDRLTPVAQPDRHSELAYSHPRQISVGPTLA